VSEAPVRAVVGDALLKKSEILAVSGNVKGALAGYDEIDRRFAEERDAGVRRRVVQALYSKGDLLGKRGNGESSGLDQSLGVQPGGDLLAAVAVYDDIVRRFGNDSDPGIRNAVGRTLLKKSESLRLAGDARGAVTAYDELIQHFDRDNSRNAHVLVATALFRKGLALGGLNDRTGANAAFDEIIRRYAGSNEPEEVRKIIAQSTAARQRLTAEASSQTPLPPMSEQPAAVENDN